MYNRHSVALLDTSPILVEMLLVPRVLYGSKCL